MKILAAGVSVRAIVESAVHSGYSVLALDAFGDRDLTAIAETRSLHRDFNARYSAEELCNASRQLAFDAVVYTSDLENHPEILSRLALDHRILGNPPQVVSAVRNWELLFAKLQRAGFAAPETIFYGNERDLDPKRCWLIKPLLSGGGHGIAFLQNERLLDHRYMVQEFLPGKPCSISFMANGRECVVIGITEQLAGVRQFGSQGFRYCGNLLPCLETIDPEIGKRVLDQARLLATFLTKEFKLTGANGIDVMLDGDRVSLLEVNPRYSASMELIERAYGLPIFHLHVQAFLYGALPDFRLEEQWRRSRFYGKAILFAERDIIAPDTQGWLLGNLHDIPDSMERLPKGGPICTIQAARSTYDETYAELIHQAEILRKEIYG
jgi:predicted ATP-grasp superfamily ATP-dependent carboligase